MHNLESKKSHARGRPFSDQALQPTGPGKHIGGVRRAMPFCVRVGADSGSPFAQAARIRANNASKNQILYRVRKQDCQRGDRAIRYASSIGLGPVGTGNRQPSGGVSSPAAGTPQPAGPDFIRVASAMVRLPAKGIRPQPLCRPAGRRTTDRKIDLRK